MSRYDYIYGKNARMEGYQAQNEYSLASSRFVNLYLLLIAISTKPVLKLMTKKDLRYFFSQLVPLAMGLH